MNSNGSFSGSDAAAMKVTAAPAIWGLARSALRLSEEADLPALLSAQGPALSAVQSQEPVPGTAAGALTSAGTWGAVI